MSAEWPEIKAPRLAEMLREDYGYDGDVVLVREQRMRTAGAPARAEAAAFS